MIGSIFFSECKRHQSSLQAHIHIVSTCYFHIIPIQNDTPVFTVYSCFLRRPQPCGVLATLYHVELTAIMVSTASPTDSASESQLEVENGSESEDQDDYVVNPLARRAIAPEGSDPAPSEHSPSPHSEFDPEPAQEEEQEPRPRKRPARPSLDTDLECRPLKRNRGALSHRYLALLNSDIEDAAARYVPHNGPKLPRSQIGLTVWTPQEKELFFEALSRLGRDDIPGIARLVKTKGELEILQYLKLLRDALAKRKEEGELAPIHMADFPAATELGPECSYALDEVADALALRQEKYEESQERLRWADSWLITPWNAQQAADTAAETRLPSLDFFKVDNWLKLSERVFMNGPSNEGNWQSVGELPSIRATALEDFYSLAVSITKRLLSTTLYFSMSRVRSKKGAISWTRSLVRVKDVEAAAASLGLQRNHKPFWAACARRLKLEIYDEAPDLTEDGHKPMPYGEVESILSAGIDDYRVVEEPQQGDPSSDDDVSSSDVSLEIEDLVKKEPSGSEGEGLVGTLAVETYSDAEAKREAAEVIQFSAMGLPETTRSRGALIARIKAELKDEEFADVLDGQSSYSEEKRMWTLLGREPVEPPVKAEAMVQPVSHGVVEDMHPTGRDWREKLRYVAEWEMAPDESGPRKITKDGPFKREVVAKKGAAGKKGLAKPRGAWGIQRHSNRDSSEDENEEADGDGNGDKAENENDDDDGEMSG